MSRIHDALEKAEQEAAARPKSASDSISSLGRVREAVDKATAEAAATGAGPAFLDQNAGRVYRAIEQAEVGQAVVQPAASAPLKRTDRFFDAMQRAEAEAQTVQHLRASILFAPDPSAAAAPGPVVAVRSAEASARAPRPAPILFETAPQRIEPESPVHIVESITESSRQGPAVSWVWPEWHPDTRRLIFYSGGNRSLAERFRTLRSRLLSLHRAQPFSTLLVASSLPDEGKTFVAANLAHALAQEESKRVGLIDADMRAGLARTRLHDLIGSSSNEYGLSDYLAGEVELDEVLQTGNIPNLSFISAGSLRSDAAELISNGMLSALLARLSQTLNWIVVDSPSFGTIADGLLLAQMCDAALMVVRADTTPVDSALRVAQELSRKRLLGVVLNRVPAVNKYH